MDFLVELETDRQKKEELMNLEKRKLKLQQQLMRLEKDLENDRIMSTNSNPTKQKNNVKQFKQVIDGYKLIGVSTQSIANDLVLRFDPIFKHQQLSTDYYCVQIKEREESQSVGQHNLPPFIPVKQLEETHLVDGRLKEFVEQIQMHLHSYVQRRDGIKQIEVDFKTKGILGVDVNLPVTYLHVRVSLDPDLPEVVVELTYDLCKTLPDSVDIQIDDSEDVSAKDKSRMTKRMTQWKQQLIHKDMYTAFNSLCKDL